MTQDKVKPDHTLASSKTGSASEGLRILARMIARHLLAEKPGVDEQHPSGCSIPCMPDTLVKEEAGNGSNQKPMGRPRLSVDFAIVLRLRDVGNMGWSRMAEAYRKITGKYISRDTIKRRYLEAKVQEAPTAIIPNQRP